MYVAPIEFAAVRHWFLSVFFCSSFRIEGGTDSFIFQL